MLFTNLLGLLIKVGTLFTNLLGLLIKVGTLLLNLLGLLIKVGEGGGGPVGNSASSLKKTQFKLIYTKLTR